MIQGVVPYAPYSQKFEAAPVYPQDVVTSCPHCSYLYYPRQRLNLPVPPALFELEEEFHQPKIHQQVSNLLAVWVLGLVDVEAEFP